MNMRCNLFVHCIYMGSMRAKWTGNEPIKQEVIVNVRYVAGLKNVSNLITRHAEEQSRLLIWKVFKNRSI